MPGHVGICLVVARMVTSTIGGKFILIILPTQYGYYRRLGHTV